MRVHACVLAILAAATGASVAANVQLPGQTPPSSPAQMTITGCLKASPNPGGVPDSTTYTLEPIEVAAPTVPASPTATPAAKTATRYTLTSSAGVALKPHAGHKVEISGHLKDLSEGKADTKAAGEPASKPREPGGAHNTFEVTALKMVAAVCP